MSFTVSDLIVETLKTVGIRRVYGIPGDSLNGFPDSLQRDGTIAWQHVRHEEAAAFAAAGEAAITGELAVCAASCGPGNLHLINGLDDAHRSRVPVVAIAAHIPSKEIGGNYFQETHPQELFRECSAYCELVTSPTHLPYALDIALRTAVEQKDVAVLAGHTRRRPAARDGAARRKLAAESSHQSCLLVTSREMPPDLELQGGGGVRGAGATRPRHCRGSGLARRQALERWHAGYQRRTRNGIPLRWLRRRGDVALHSPLRGA